MQISFLSLWPRYDYGNEPNMQNIVTVSFNVHTLLKIKRKESTIHKVLHRQNQIVIMNI
jgi:hypothetical protein